MVMDMPVKKYLMLLISILNTERHEIAIKYSDLIRSQSILLREIILTICTIKKSDI